MSLDTTSARAGSPLRVAWQVARKEFKLFLSSPIAWLFFAVFAAVTLFVFFWGEAFFARNIADVRPVFEWMPMLLILLCSTLTMKMWSEERRTGTLEHVLTQAAPSWSFVLGKFFGCVLLLALALVIIVPLPITVAQFGDIDWGPVWAGFLATLLLGAAYIAIGLFVSSRTQNQIVSFIGSVVLCGFFWLIGHALITNYVNQSTAEILQGIGTGARFESITRGVIDVADLVYFGSLTIVFLVLTVFILEKERWGAGDKNAHHKGWKIGSVLIILNALVVNFWVSQIHSLRVDTTNGKQFSLSDATSNVLGQLQEPLTIRGYFSAKTHPLLSPLVPQMRDLLREYEVAGNGKVRVEFIDPLQNPEAEEEANQQYGIEPTPFQVADRYQSSIVSSYFDVLMEYGDEFEVLGFRDLIDVKSQSATNLDVQLRNPEYDVTKSIRRVLTDFQAAGDVFASMASPVELQAYLSADDQLPEDLIRFRQDIESVVTKLSGQAAGKLSLNIVNPDADGGQIAQQLGRDYGFRPMTAGLFSPNQFWFHLLLNDGNQLVKIPLDDLSRTKFEANLDTGLKRFAKGFTKQLALVASNEAEYANLRGYLSNEYDVVLEDLTDGSIASDAELLVLASPDNLDDKSLFAVDQFLMQGGTVIAATSPFSASFMQNQLNLQKTTSGLQPWLEHHGVEIGETLVMDPQNAAFPAPVSRSVGGMQIQEMRMLDYPYFIDVRQNGMSENSAVVSGLGQVTMAWASPITLAENDERSSEILLRSSPNAWLSDSTDILPRLDAGNGQATWSQEGETSEHVLGVSVKGRFDSYFAEQSSPVAAVAEAEEKQPGDETTGTLDETLDNIVQGNNPAVEEAATEDEQTKEPSLAESVDTVIERSTESAQLIVLSSSDFLRDQITQVAGAATGTQYIAPYQLLANAVDVSLDDTGLLGIRARGQFNRTLPPMSTNQQRFWEYLNYALAALAIAVIYGISRLWRRRTEKKQLAWLSV